MDRMHRLAQMLVCSWALGGEGPEDLPASPGVLDRALELARAAGAFPGWFWDEVHFADSRVGLLCVELPDVLEWAQTAELTEAAHPSYRRTRVKVGPALARRLLADLGIAADDAAAWGKVLRAATVRASGEFAVAS